MVAEDNTEAKAGRSSYPVAPATPQTPAATGPEDLNSAGSRRSTDAEQHSPTNPSPPLRAAPQRADLQHLIELGDPGSSRARKGMDRADLACGRGYRTYPTDFSYSFRRLSSAVDDRTRAAVDKGSTDLEDAGGRWISTMTPRSSRRGGGVREEVEHPAGGVVVERPIAMPLTGWTSCSQPRPRRPDRWRCPRESRRTHSDPRRPAQTRLGVGRGPS